MTTYYSKPCQHLSQYSIVATAFFLPVSITLTDIFYLASVFFVLIAGNWREKFRQIINNPIALGFWVILGLFFWGLTYTIAPWHAAWHDIYKHHWLLFTPLLMTIFTEEKWRRYVINAFLIAMMGTLLLSYVQYFDLAQISHKFSGADIFFAHIVQNFFMAFAAMLLLLRFFNHSSPRWLYGILFLLTAYNVLFMSTGRTGYIAFAAMLAFVCAKQFGWKGLLTAAASIVVLFGLAYLASPAFKLRIDRTIHSQHQYTKGHTHTSLGYKIAMAENSYLLLLERPLFGFGTGAIKYAFQTLPKMDTDKSGIVDYVETGYLNIALEFGLIGLALFLLFFYLQWRYSSQLNPNIKTIIQVFLIGYLIGAIANPFFLSFCEVHLYSILAALAFSGLPLRQQALAKTDQPATEVCASENCS